MSGKGRQGFASMDRDQVKRIASKGGRTSGGRNERDYSEDDEDDFSEDSYDSYEEQDNNRGSNPNRVRGGKKAAETRRRRGTGFFENMDREQLSEIGRRGGQKGGRASGRQYDNEDEEEYSEDDYSEDGGDNSRGSNPNRVRGGKKAAETRRRRGTGYFENMSREKLSEMGRKGGSRSNRGGDDDDTPRSKRQRR